MYCSETPLLSSLESLSLGFSEARSREQVADLLSGYIAQEFDSGGLFIVRGTVAVGWRGVNGNGKIAGFEDLNILLSKPSLLKDVVESRNASLGVLVNTPENRHIMAALGVRSDAAILTLPLVMLNKVVAVILIADDLGLLELRLAELQRIVRKAALAFEMLIIKHKIVMT